MKEVAQQLAAVLMLLNPDLSLRSHSGTSMFQQLEVKHVMSEQ